MQLDELMSDRQQRLAELQEAQDLFDEADRAVQEYMLANRLKTTDANGFKVTIVERETMKIDEQALLSYIGKRYYNKVCTQKIDRKLLEQAVAKPDFPLDMKGLSQFVIITKSKPFLRVTDQEEVDPADGE